MKSNPVAMWTTLFLLRSSSVSDRMNVLDNISFQTMKTFWSKPSSTWNSAILVTLKEK